MLLAATQTLAMASSGRVEPSMGDLVTRSWAKTAIAATKRFDGYLETLKPNCIQKGADFIGARIYGALNKLKPFSNWLDAAIGGNWYQKLALTLVKLPFQVSRAILNMLYHIIKESLAAPFHPLIAINKLAKLLIALADALTKAETYSLIGVNILGMFAGQACLGNPYSVIGLIVGAALVVSGLGVGALIEAIQAEKGHKTAVAMTYIKQQTKPLAMAFVTSFVISVSLGAITKFVLPRMISSDISASSLPSQSTNQSAVSEALMKNFQFPTGPEQVEEVTAIA